AGKSLTEASPAFASENASIVDISVSPTLTRLNEVEHRSDRGTTGALFWYDVDGQSAVSRYDAKRFVLWNALTRGRTNGAVIAVGWDAPAGVDPRLARERALDFVRSLVPVLPKYLPSRA